MIELSKVTKSYSGNTAVSDISFSVDAGEIVGFLGPNGAGKTTTMNIITGYITPTGGDARVDGIDVLSDPIAAKRRIGYLPEQPPLYGEMTVLEYLDFVYMLKRVKADSRSKHLDDVCGRAGIADVRGRLIRNLSKGYRQRVGLAQALIGDPGVLILDEPTVGLDPAQIIEIRETIKSLGKSRTVVLSTHILPEVSAVCDRVIVISRGKIVADGTPQSLAAQFSGGDKLLVRVAGEPDGAIKVLRAVDGVAFAESRGSSERGTCDFELKAAESADIRAPLFHALAGAGMPLLMMKSAELSLEEIFLRLTSGDAVIENDKMLDAQNSDVIGAFATDISTAEQSVEQKKRKNAKSPGGKKKPDGDEGEDAR